MKKRIMAAAILALTLALCAGAAQASGMRPKVDPVKAQEEARAKEENATHPTDADGLAQFQVLREYFEWQATLDDRMPSVFSRRVREEETLAFIATRETVNRRGNLDRIRQAKVDLSGLTFRRITADPDLARIQVTGSYTFTVSPLVQTVEEDALFVLLPEMGKWKIYERREGWR